MVKKCLNIVNVVCEWPHPRTFSVHNLRNNCHFLNHLPTPMSLRNSRPETLIEIKIPYLDSRSIPIGLASTVCPCLEIEFHLILKFYVQQICSGKIWILDRRPETLIEVEIPYTPPLWRDLVKNFDLEAGT